MLTIAVDPGEHACGVAWGPGGGGKSGVLVKCELRSLPLEPPAEETECICEKPQVYSGSRVRTSNLVDLAIAAGRMTGNVPTRYVLPREWKGQLPCNCATKANRDSDPTKCTHHRRMYNALATVEWELVYYCGAPKGLLHNVYDAVSLLLWRFGRM